MNTTLPIDTIIHGDALEILKTLDSNSVDALCCDPPAGINFMNKDFDKDRGGRDNWVSWLSSIMKEAMRAMKPGAHGLIWSLPRTSHWTMTALEDAGFTIRDNIYNIVSGDTTLHNFISSLNEEQQHAFMQIIDGQREPSGILNLFGSGFPKSLGVSAAIDKLLGKEREIIDYVDGRGTYDGGKRTPREKFTGNVWNNGKSGGTTLAPITKPASDVAKQFDGYGTNLKPAVENWILVRKPLAASSIVENVLQYGTGALNIDKSRVGTDIQDLQQNPTRTGWIANSSMHDDTYTPNSNGRWPSHLLLTHHPLCVNIGTKRVRGSHDTGKAIPYTDSVFTESNGDSGNGYTDEDGMETVTAWQCVDECPVRILDQQGGLRKSGGGIKAKAGSSIGLLRGDEAYHFKHDNSTFHNPSEGFVSRYFQQFPALDDVTPYIYAGKASKRDRNSGLDNLPEKQGFDKNTSKLIAHINHSTGETTYNEYHPSSNKNTHPTVKSVHGLMRYLVRLITPPNGIVLDCFAGSGSTLVAAIHEGFHFIGIEKEQEYIEIAQKRIEHAISTTNNNAHQSTNTLQQSTTQSINTNPDIIQQKPRRKTKQTKEQNNDIQQYLLWNEDITV